MSLMILVYKTTHVTAFLSPSSSLCRAFPLSLVYSFQSTDLAEQMTGASVEEDEFVTAPSSPIAGITPYSAGVIGAASNTASPSTDDTTFHVTSFDNTSRDIVSVTFHVGADDYTSNNTLSGFVSVFLRIRDDPSGVDDPIYRITPSDNTFSGIVSVTPRVGDDPHVAASSGRIGHHFPPVTGSGKISIYIYVFVFV